MPLVLSASASLGFQDTGTNSHGFLKLPPGIPRSTLSSKCISSMAPSVKYAADFALPHKRLCNATSEQKGSGSKKLGSNNGMVSTPGSKCQVPAHSRDRSSNLVVAELGRPSEDGFCRLDLSPEFPERLKSAKELHFEAIKSYCPNYDDEYYYNNVVGLKGPVTCLTDLKSLDTHVEQGKDAVGPPQDIRDRRPGVSIKYVDVCEGDFLNAKSAREQVYRFEPSTETNHESSTKNDLRKQSLESSENVQQVELTIESQPAASAKSKPVIVRNKRKDKQDCMTGPCKVLTRRTLQDNQETPVLHRSLIKASTKEVGLDNANQLLDQSQNQKDFQQSMHQIKDGGSEKESPTLEAVGDLSKEQKIRMEINKAAALARRNMRICEDNAAQAQAQGLPFPKFESLLVEKSWLEVLRLEFQKPYMEHLQSFVKQEAAGKVPIYPAPAKLFNAFNSCPFNKVKVVIIGQDPYHGPGQAMGLCFSVEKGDKLPSSLVNIFTEIANDLQVDFPSHGNLERWAHQGVLLLNTVLTVRDHHANSHAKRGWELFTDAAIRALAQQRSGLVFLLWGNQAQEKIRLINKTSHHVLKAFHPSGISAHRGFFKCRHFSKTNQILQDQGLLPIDWQV